MMLARTNRPGTQRAPGAGKAERDMTEYTVQVEGMACGMCEAHVNDAVRRAFPAAERVRSSHRKGQTVILARQPLDEQALRQAIGAAGYRAGAISARPARRKGLLGLLG